MALELPNGFDKASDDVQHELLSTHRSEDLVEAIRNELGKEGRHSPQLTKRDKAAILLALRD